MNEKDIFSDVKELVLETGLFIRDEIQKIKAKDIELKGINDFVTYVDKYSERKIVEGLIGILSESGFITEEQTINKKGERYNWIIDPLDGTTNYVHGAPPYSISIALTDNEEIVLGVVYEITLNELFYTWRGEYAYLNDKRIEVSRTGTVRESLIATGFPYNDYNLLKKYLNLLEYFLRNSHGIRRLGSAATDLSYVACGRYDTFYEYSLNAWDVAAGAFIVQQAGGKVCDFNGGNNWLYGNEIIASNNLMFDEFRNIVKRFMK